MRAILVEYVAAIFSENRIVTGATHGDAFGLLTLEEQNNKIKSGFFNPNTGEFLNEDGKEVFLKQLFLVRHADVEMGEHLSSTGQHHAKQVSERFLNDYNLTNYQCFSSTAARCQETAHIFCDLIHLPITLLSGLEEQQESELPFNFCSRLKKILQILPFQSIVFTHCNCISNLLYLALKSDVCCNGIIPPCSITYINGDKLDWIGREW